MYMNRFLQMSFSQMMFDMISDIYDQFSRSLITFIVLLALALFLCTCFTPYIVKNSTKFLSLRGFFHVNHLNYVRGPFPSFF